jgi:hypothetical protein
VDVVVQDDAWCPPSEETPETGVYPVGPAVAVVDGHIRVEERDSTLPVLAGCWERRHLARRSGCQIDGSRSPEREPTDVGNR